MTGIILAIDAMGGDHAPDAVLDGVEAFAARHPAVRFRLCGDPAKLTAGLASRPRAAKASEVVATDKVIPMDMKPAVALRQGRGSSMATALEAVRDGAAQAVVSAGNTGALMALALFTLRAIPGVQRPAIAANWPTMKGRTVVLDVGAQVEATPTQLIEFAIMGEAFSRAVNGVAAPSVGLLNIGSEDMKGREELREAARLIREGGFPFPFHGFVEGTDIAYGTVDVVATDGFTGNVALKTAEGTAKLVGGWVKEGLTDGLLAKLGAVLASGSLKKMKARLDPRTSNGGVFLGLNGVVVKAHGSSDGYAFSHAMEVALKMASADFIDAVRERLAEHAPRLQAVPAAAAATTAPLAAPEVAG